MAKIRGLRSAIYGLYDSEAEFAREIGWTRQQLSKITNGQKIPDVAEINALASGLHTSVESVCQFFLNRRSPNEQQGPVT